MEQVYNLRIVKVALTGAAFWRGPGLKFRQTLCKMALVSCNDGLTINEKFPNFENRTFPKLAKTKSSEISV